jgi:hypothetical protein
MVRAMPLTQGLSPRARRRGRSALGLRAAVVFTVGAVGCASSPDGGGSGAVVPPEPSASARPEPSASASVAAPEPSVVAVTGRSERTRTVYPGETLHKVGPRCTLMPHVTCPPPPSTCNPPPPLEVVCPDAVAKAPPGKAGWARVPEKVFAFAPTSCSYVSDSFCPGGGVSAPTPCTPTRVAELACTKGEGKAVRVPSFTFQDGLGDCYRAPAFECDKGVCPLPSRTPIACSEL